jgi:hypothetical protein
VELPAVYRTLKTIEHYCTHRTINIFSDNISLFYFKRIAMGSPREKCMATFLMGFRLNFCHVSGRRANMLADSVSRCVEEMSSTEVEQWIPTVHPKDAFLFAISQKGQTDPAESRKPDTGNQVCVSNTGPGAQDIQPNTGWVFYYLSFQQVDPMNEPTSKATPVATADQNKVAHGVSA